MEQIFDRLAENPNDFPKNISTVIISAMAGPETYQGQGWRIKEIIMPLLVMIKDPYKMIKTVFCLAGKRISLQYPKITI
jgi:hypothetical protein